MIGKRAVRGCLFFLFLSSLGLARTARALVEDAGDESSRSVEAESVDRSIEMEIDDDRKMIAQLASESVSIEADLASRVATGELTAEQSAEIAGDLGRLEGMAYRVPSVETLKLDLGFPKETEIEDADLPELVRAHLQVVFGLNALSAAYIADRLGVKVDDDVRSTDVRTEVH